MKKLLTTSFILAAMLVACTKKVVPDTGAASDKSQPAKVDAAKTEAEIKADAEAKAKIEAGEEPASPATPVMSDMERGKSIITGKCTGCHAMKNTGDYTFSQWQNILRSMVPKAKLSGEEEKQLTAYIKANAKQ